MAMSPSENKVKFMDDFSKAQRIAKKQNKILMVDFTASWCGACRMMDRDVFSDSKLVRYISSNAVAVKVDIDQFDGMLVKQEYGVTVLPTVLFFYPDGQVAHRVERVMSAREIEQTIEDHTELLVHQKGQNSNSSRWRRQVEEHQANKLRKEEAAKKEVIGQSYKIVLVRTSSYDTALRFYQRYETETTELLTIFESQRNNIYSLTMGDFDSPEEARRMLSEAKRFCEDARIKAMTDL